MRSVRSAGKEVGITGHFRDRVDHAHGRHAEVNNLRSGLAVGQSEATMIMVHVRALECQDLVPATPREHQQSDRGQGEGALHAKRRRAREDLTQPRQLGG